MSTGLTMTAGRQMHSTNTVAAPPQDDDQTPRQGTGNPPANEPKQPAEPPAAPPQGTGVTPADPPAGAKNTEAVPDSWDGVFKHPRFAQILDRAKAAEARLAKIEADNQKATEEAAKQRGEYEKLYNEEKARTAALLAEQVKGRVELALRDYLASKQPDYVGRAKWIAPFIGAIKDGASDEDIQAAVKAAADAWVKDNPIAPTPPGGPGNHAPRGNGGNKPDDETRRAQSYRPRL